MAKCVSFLSCGAQAQHFQAKFACYSGRESFHPSVSFMQICPLAGIRHPIRRTTRPQSSMVGINIWLYIISMQNRYIRAVKHAFYFGPSIRANNILFRFVPLVCNELSVLRFIWLCFFATNIIIGIGKNLSWQYGLNIEIYKVLLRVMFVHL